MSWQGTIHGFKYNFIMLQNDFMQTQQNAIDKVEVNVTEQQFKYWFSGNEMRSVVSETDSIWVSVQSLLLLLAEVSNRLQHG